MLHRRRVGPKLAEIRQASTGKCFEAKERGETEARRGKLFLRAIVKRELRPHFDLDSTVRRWDEPSSAGHLDG